MQRQENNTDNETPKTTKLFCFTISGLQVSMFPEAIFFFAFKKGSF